MTNQICSKRTPLYEEHISLNARMVPFGGWEMPLQYEGILKEYEQTRKAAALFDISHMGIFKFEGPDALPFLEQLVCNQVEKSLVNKMVYGMILNHDGMILDDIMVGFLDGAFYMIVNAGNRDKIWSWCQSGHWITFNETNTSDNC